MKPTIGRIVHLNYGHECRPAIITSVTSMGFRVTEFRPYDGPYVIDGFFQPGANDWHDPRECPNE